MSLEELFSAVLLDHYRHPRHQGQVENPDVQLLGANPLCGDEIELSAKINGDGLSDVGFTGKSCAICIAATSMFCERAGEEGMPALDELKELFYKMIHGGELTDEERERLGDLAALQGVAKLPSRVKCATLVWETWQLMKKQLKMKDEK